MCSKEQFLKEIEQEKFENSVISTQTDDEGTVDDLTERLIIEADETIIEGEASLMVNSTLSDNDFQWISYVSTLEPVTQQEADAALDTINSSPQILSRFLPPSMAFGEMDPVAWNGLLSEVKDLVTDPEIIARTQRNLLGFQTSNEENSLKLHDDEEEKNLSGDGRGDDWIGLASRYHCGICKGVLAGPNLLNCSHSFCGDCLKEHKDRVSSSNEVDVCHHCPECKSVITSETFETVLDLEISRQIDKLPDSQEKMIWKRKRRAYYNRFLDKLENPSSTFRSRKTENSSFLVGKTENENGRRTGFQTKEKGFLERNWVIGGLVTIVSVVVVILVRVALKK